MELMLRDSRLSGVLCGFFGRGARNKQVTEEDQKKIRRRSEEDQKKIRRKSEENQKKIRRKRRRRRRRRVKKVGTPVRKALLAAVCPPLGAG